MNPKIIFEDEFLLILNKPSGWIVNEAETTRGQKVIQTWLRENFQFPISNNRTLRNGVVHRLDKETSGVLVVAKTEKGFKDLQSQFKAREVKKEYTALVHGKVELEKGIIKVPVGRLPWNKERFGVLPGGREAETKYQVISYYRQPVTKPINHYTLLTLRPTTGRTHQIRIHLKYLGYPIVSDTFYAGRKTARADRQWCPRLFLHAAKIAFKHPASKKKVEYASELPRELSACLGKLSPLNLT